jgi:hypothetical protein
MMRPLAREPATDAADLQIVVVLSRPNALPRSPVGGLAFVDVPTETVDRMRAQLGRLTLHRVPSSP